MVKWFHCSENTEKTEERWVDLECLKEKNVVIHS